LLVYSLKCLTCSLYGKVNILLACGLHLGNSLLRGGVNGAESFARLALVPLIVYEELQTQQKDAIISNNFMNFTIKNESLKKFCYLCFKIVN